MLGIIRNQPLFQVEKRLLTRDGEWLVRTREIPELGPFGSRLEAIEALYRHVAICTGALSSQDPEMACEFARHSVTECKEPNCVFCADLLILSPKPERKLRVAF